ncbi:DNA-directed RNA polymerase II subunit RPB1 [Labeo rohita]|uniref:DNA-directed RNA polymerase II subunit RPB1 n=1 Tax=Labeo rohita TaxID=84645 RepID=A0ABQ8M9Q8_LABRO|nr:DNA-directed RNA polymerase II subunit RPB1 [Labeo rohita]
MGLHRVLCSQAASSRSHVFQAVSAYAEVLCGLGCAAFRAARPREGSSFQVQPRARLCSQVQPREDFCSKGGLGSLEAQKCPPSLPPTPASSLPLLLPPPHSCFLPSWLISCPAPPQAPPPPAPPPLVGSLDPPPGCPSSFRASSKVPTRFSLCCSCGTWPVSAHHLCDGITAQMVCQSPLVSWLENSLSLPPTSEFRTPHRPVDPPASPWFLAPSSPPWPGSPLAPPGSLIPPAPPWSSVAPAPTWPSGPTPPHLFHLSPPDPPCQPGSSAVQPRLRLLHHLLHRRWSAPSILLLGVHPPFEPPPKFPPVSPYVVPVAHGRAFQDVGDMSCPWTSSLLVPRYFTVANSVLDIVLLEVERPAYSLRS